MADDDEGMEFGIVRLATIIGWSALSGVPAGVARPFSISARIAFVRSGTFGKMKLYLL